MIHQVELGENANRSLSHRIDAPGELECLRVDDVNVRWRYSEDDAVGFGNILGNERSRLLLNVRWLVADRNLSGVSETPENADD